MFYLFFLFQNLPPTSFIHNILKMEYILCTFPKNTKASRIRAKNAFRHWNYYTQNITKPQISFMWQKK